MWIDSGGSIVRRRRWTVWLSCRGATGLLLFDKGQSKADVLQSLADDATINDLVRHRATELARDWK
jgi:hypothetical protein